MTDRLYSQSIGAQIAMEVGEEMMRGMPTCSKHEWQPKGRRKKIGGLFSDYGFCPVGSCSVDGLLSGGLLSPLPGQEYPKEKMTHFVSRQEPELFFLRTVSPTSA